MPVELAIITVVILIISIILHEVSHGYMAHALGDPTAKLAGRLTLNPIPHIDLLGSIIIPAFLVLSPGSFLFGWAKPVPYNPLNLKNQRYGEALVAVAGSATNIFLAVLFALIIRFGTGLPETFVVLAAAVVLINLFLGIFNLIPIPPLDGYTVLRSLLPYRFSVPLQNLERRVQSLGIFSLIIFLFLFVFLFAQPFFLFVYYIFTLLVGPGASLF